MGLSMHLTAIGTEQRRSIVIILHQSSQPRPQWSMMDAKGFV
jgi:hypothetical protein